MPYAYNLLEQPTFDQASNRPLYSEGEGENGIFHQHLSQYDYDRWWGNVHWLAISEISTEGIGNLNDSATKLISFIFPEKTNKQIKKPKNREAGRGRAT